MSKQYIAREKETLKQIAKAHMGDAKLADALADFNGLVLGGRLATGQAIEIPTARELAPVDRPRPRAAAWPAAPQGLRGIIATFGNLSDYLRDDGTLDPQWEIRNMLLAPLPFAIPLDWDPTKRVTRIRCHRLLVPLYEAVFAEIVAQGLKSSLNTYGGAYQYRAKRNGAKPSTHSWGIAIDFNVSTNPMGRAGDMDPRLVALMEDFGFVWGGRWSGASKDPMHFQYCTGY